MQESDHTQPAQASDGPTGFRILVEDDSHGVRVKVFGELDVATGPELDRILDGLRDGPGRVMIDLAGVQFIDSTGLSSIVRAHVVADGDGRPVTVRRGDVPQIQRLLELTSMLDRLHFED